MRPAQLRLSRTDLVLTGFGAVLILAACLVSVRLGATLGAATALVAALFLGTALAYMTVPHLALVGTTFLFAFVPMLKVFASPQIGGVKDLVCLAAIAAGAFLAVFERRRTDRGIAMLVLLLLVLYVINIGGSHGTAWAQGLRLFGEPLLLLLVGLLLPHPQRNLRYAMGALAAMAVIMAGYGLLQQALGQYRLVSLGYAFNDQVRTIGGHLRSFGTLDDPFAYAAFLVFGVTALLMWWRRGTWVALGMVVLLAGLAVSYVRTAALILLGLATLMLIRAGWGRSALFLGAGGAIIAAITLTHAGGTQSQVFAVYNTKGGYQLVSRPLPGTASVLLNGRVSAWRTALGDKPIQWVFGRGVGTVGTAAARASYSISPPSKSTSSSTSDSGRTQAVDSGYLATVADVGVVGLILLLALLGRIGVLAWRAANRGQPAGWVALGLLACMMIDALTRASFTGFPTAFLGLLLLGVALAAAMSPEPARLPGGR